MYIQLKLNSVFSRFSESLSHLEQAALKKANPKALRRTLTTLRTKTKQELASAYKVPGRLFANRLKDSLSSSKQSARFWAGLNEFDLYNLGKAVQLTGGVKVNDYFEPGAFIQTVRRGQASSPLGSMFSL